MTMSKYLLWIVLLGVVLSTLVAGGSASANVVDDYALHFAPDDIAPLLALDREDEDLATKAEKLIGDGYIKFADFRKRNQYILELLEVLETVEVPMLWGRLPYDIYYRPQSDCIEFYYRNDYSGYVRYDLYFTSSQEYQWICDREFLEEKPLVLGEKINLYYVGDLSYDGTKGPRCVWRLFLQINGYNFICEYVGNPEAPGVLGATEIQQALREAPVATVADFCPEVRQEPEEPVNLVLLVSLICCVVVFSAIIAGWVIIVVVKRVKAKY